MLPIPSPHLPIVSNPAPSVVIPFSQSLPIYQPATQTQTQSTCCHHAQNEHVLDIILSIAPGTSNMYRGDDNVSAALHNSPLGILTIW